MGRWIQTGEGRRTSGVHGHKGAMMRMVYDGVKRTAYDNFRLLGRRIGLGRPVMKSCFNANEREPGTVAKTNSIRANGMELLISWVGGLLISRWTLRSWIKETR